MRCAKTFAGRQLDERMTRTGGTFGTAVSPDGNFVASAEEDGHGATFYDTRPSMSDLEVAARRAWPQLRTTMRADRYNRALQQ